MNDRVSRIAGREQDFESRPPSRGLVRELPAVDAPAHHHIRKQQIDIPDPIDDLTRDRPGRRIEDPVSKLGQNFGGEVAKLVIVLGDKNSLRPDRTVGLVPSPDSL
jgi:hypothetical protein